MFILILLLNQSGSRLFHLLSLMEVSQPDVDCLMIKALWYRSSVVQVTLCSIKGRCVLTN
jgi:hypothetical protein